MEPHVPIAEPPASIGAAITMALEAYEALTVVGEEVEDEWQYVQDLSEAWRERLSAVADDRADEALAPVRGAAVSRVCAEVETIEDPHRAIDWLSTFPQVVLAALDERP